MKKLKVIIALALLLCLVAGCGNAAVESRFQRILPEASSVQTPSASSASSPPPSSTSIAPYVHEQVYFPNYAETEQYKTAPEWQQAYFDMLYGKIKAQEDDFPYRIEFYYHGDGPPMIEVSYLSLSVYTKTWYGNTTYKQLWRIVDGRAVLHWDFTLPEGTQFAYAVAPSTGDVLLSKYSTDERNGQPCYTYIAYDPVTKTQTPLCDQYFYSLISKGDIGKTAVYTYADGRAWTWREYLTQDNILPTRSFTSSQDLFDLVFGDRDREFHVLEKAQMLAEDLINYYVPNVPPGTPGWVSAYICYIRRQLWANPYVHHTEEEIKLVGSPRVTIYAPLYSGGIPLIKNMNFASAGPGTHTPHYIMNGRVRNFGGVSMETGYEFLRAENGTPVFTSTSYSGATWSRAFYAMDAAGFYVWLHMGYYTCEDNSGGYAYIGRELEWFDTGAQANEWLESRKAAWMPSPIVGEWDSVTCTLPQTGTWAEMEAVLVNAFCRFT